MRAILIFLLWSKAEVLCGCGPEQVEYTVQARSMMVFFGLLFPSSFAMRSLGGSAKAYGDGIGSNGTHLRLIDCMSF